MVEEIEEEIFVSRSGFVIPNNWLQIVEQIPVAELNNYTPEELADYTLYLLLGYPTSLQPRPFEHNSESKAASVAYGLFEFERMVASEKSEAVNSHLAHVFQNDLMEFWLALMSGGNHPLLQRWKELRQHRSKRSIREKHLQELSVLGAFVFSAHGMTLGKAYSAVANIVNSSGVFENEVSAKTVSNWRFETSLERENDLTSLSSALKLGDFGQYAEQSRLFRFWSQWLNKTLLATGMSVIDQLLAEGIYPLEGYPESVRKTFDEDFSLKPPS